MVGLRVVTGTVAAFGLAISVSASATVISLVNPGFEEPNAAKIQDGFDGATDVPGWLDTDTAAYVDTGVEAAGQHSGSWRAFARSTDGGAYQLSSYQMQEGDQITLTWWAIDGWNGSQQTVELLSAASTGDAYAATSVLDSSVDDLTGSWTEYTLSYIATAADAGKYVGVSFVNTSTTEFNWAGWDDFSLNATEVPEPASLALMGLGGLLMVARRRNA